MTAIQQMMIGSAADPILDISPLNQSDFGTLATNIFALTTVSVIGGTPSSYTWSLNLQNGGTFSITSGQGTASVATSVASVMPGNTATARLICELVIGGRNFTIFSDLSYERS